MADAGSSLAEDFPPLPREAWLAIVDKTLKGAPFDSLVRRTDEGLAIQPLYTADDARPVALALPARDVERPWDIRAAVAHPSPVQANTELLKDLENGAASGLVRFDPTGRTGIAVGSQDDLARALSGVVLDLAPIALDAGFLGPQAADWLGALAKGGPAAPLALHMDPLSAFAETGESPGPVESHVVSAATVGMRLSRTYPKASLFLASGRVVHEAGGGEAMELAVMAAAAVAYVRALERAGMALEPAFAAVVLGLAASEDYFLTIAKLRAARAIWDRIAGAAGVSAPARIEARSSRRMLTRLDPWTNLIRLTSAGFGAAVGGADAIVLGAFTDALGLPTAFARRQARNTQLILMEEANLGRVADPAAGTWAIERMTDDLARAAWAEFQAIEAAGGIVAALTSGHIAAKVAAVREAAQAAYADKRPILGVTAYPQPGQAAVETEAADPAAFAVASPKVRLPGPDGACPPLTPIRWAAPFEEVEA